MNGPQLNVAFANPGRIRTLQENTDVNHFNGNERAFLVAVIALQVNQPQEIIPAVYAIIDTIASGNQENRSALINFANTQLDSSFMVTREQLEIEQIGTNQPCQDGHECGGCVDEDYCFA